MVSYNNYSLSDRRRWEGAAEPECDPFFQPEIFNP
jgi:hypothetical protein